jgi:hypothetical protein
LIFSVDRPRRYSVASWIGQLFVAIFICHKLHEQGADLTEWVNRRNLKIFTTRSSDVGFAGSYLAYLPTTADKRAQADTLESGSGKRRPNVLVVRSDSDMGEATRESMEGSYESEVYIRSEMAAHAPPQRSSQHQSSSSFGQPHLREIVGAGASAKRH